MARMAVTACHVVLFWIWVFQFNFALVPSWCGSVLNSQMSPENRCEQFRTNFVLFQLLFTAPHPHSLTDHGRKRKNVLSWKETFCREERNNCQAQDRVLVEKVKCWDQPPTIHWIITWLLFSLWITFQSTVSDKIDKGMTWVCAVLFWKTKQKNCILKK